MVGVVLAGAMAPAYGQQWNSDNYWTSPRGTLTAVVTVGQDYSTLLNVVAFAPNWEFNLGATLFQEDKSSNTVRHFSTIAYFKYMINENAAKNGGWSVMFGSGVVPGFYQTAGTMTVQFGDLLPVWLAQAYATAGPAALFYPFTPDSETYRLTSGFMDRA